MIEVRVTAAPSIVLEGEVLVLWASCSTSLSSVAVLVRSISEGSVSGILVRAQFRVELWNVCFGNSLVNIVAPATTCFTTATLAVLGDMSEVIVAATPAVVLECKVLVLGASILACLSTVAVCMWSISEGSASSVLVWSNLFELVVLSAWQNFVNVVAPATTCFTTATLAVLGDMSEVIVAATPAVVLESNVLVIWTCCRTRFSTEAVCMWSISKSSTSSVLIWTKLIEENGAEFGINLEKGGVNDVLTMLLEVLVDKVTSVE